MKPTLTVACIALKSAWQAVQSGFGFSRSFPTITPPLLNDSCSAQFDHAHCAAKAAATFITTLLIALLLSAITLHAAEPPHILVREALQFENIGDSVPGTRPLSPMFSNCNASRMRMRGGSAALSAASGASSTAARAKRSTTDEA